MKECTLVILAAGKGERYEGAKQIEAIGPNNEYLMEYSIYDAIRVGFSRVVFIIRKEHEKRFQEKFIELEKLVEIEYVIQTVDELPEGYAASLYRTKPWGTGQAIYAARNAIKGPFAVINADDYYGRDAFEVMMEFLQNNESRDHYLTIGYKVKNTLSENGTVKRGICKINLGVLEEIVESIVGIVNGDIFASPLSTSKPFKITDDDYASVNFFGFTPYFLRITEDDFPKFLDENLTDLEAEYLITDLITNQIKEGKATMYVKDTTSKWLGMTYKEDKENLKENVNKFIEEGRYPRNLWE